MSVELDPPELGFKREQCPHAFLCAHTERGRPLPARGVADPPSQEPSLRPRRIQGKQAPACCCVMQEETFGLDADDCRSKPPPPSSTNRPTSPAPPLPANKRLLRYCVRPNSGRIEPGRDVEVQSTTPPRIALHCALMQAQSNPLTRAYSPSPGHEGGPAARCQVPRQVPRPVRPRHR